MDRAKVGTRFSLNCAQGQRRYNSNYGINERTILYFFCFCIIILWMNLEKETVLEFIQNKIRISNDVKADILDKIKYVIDDDHSSQGFYYERLWDICIKFGATDITMPSSGGFLQTSHIINENSNKIGIQFEKNCWKGNVLDKHPSGYLSQSVRSGNSGGYSDITFINKAIDTYIETVHFISVKYFKTEKDASRYDIAKLCTLVREHEQKDRIIKVYIFVKDKKNAISKFASQNASSNLLIKYINPNGRYEHVYDINDLQSSFFRLKKILEQYNFLETLENINDFEKNHLMVLKDIFIPRFHQQIFIKSINKLITMGEKNILVGAIPRSGKSYIMAGTILEYVRRSPQKKVKFLMITPAPNETFGEYESIFNSYIDFERLGIDVITHKGGITSKQVCKNKDRHCVIIISKQKLGWTPDSKDEAFLNESMDADIKNIEKSVLKLLGTNPDIDMIFLDEAHFGMSTDKAQQIVDVLRNTIGNTINIFVTATYNKPLQAYGVKSNCKLTWDMNDIKTMQTLDKEGINDNRIKNQFGTDIYTDVLEYFGDKSGSSLIEVFRREYAIYPKPYMITSLWDKDFLNIEKLKIGDTEFGWDMNKLFATIDNTDNFANEEQIKEMMRYYFGSPDKHDGYDKQSFYRSRGILPRIRNICANRCRTLQQNHNTSQLWFLPVGQGIITHKMRALVQLLTKTNEFRDIKNTYHFFVAVVIDDHTSSDDVTYLKNPLEIKNEIEKVERDIRDGKHKANNLIILAGQRLQLGISLRNVDIVTLWNSTTSADAIFQMLFRSMTEVDEPVCLQNEYCPQKRFGFMVDMNPQRLLMNVNMFTENMSKAHKYRHITDLINIDEDVLYEKYGNSESKKDKFVSDLFNKLYAAWDISTKNIKMIIRKFSFDITKLETLKELFIKININKNKKQQTQIDGQDEDDVLPAGNKKEKAPSESMKKPKPIDLSEIASEVLAEFISLLNIFTLYTDDGAKCMLIDTHKKNTQITVIDDINTLKNRVLYANTYQKTIFLKILNGRLTGNIQDMYPEVVIDTILDAMDNTSDKHVINKIIMTQKNEYYTIHEPDKLLEFINGELKPKEKEKKENGEVFTPLSLVNEMMDKLDEVYTNTHGHSIFTEKDFKWLDNAVGIGNFTIVVYQRLMTSLSIMPESKRRKHILEKMLYASELTPKNVFIYKKIFCGDTKYKLNIHEGDSLKMDVVRDFDLPSDFGGFDVVMGNPPFQKLNAGLTKTTTAIWDKFILKSIASLAPDRYLLYINPSGWRNVYGNYKNAQDAILSRKLHYLEIHDEKDGQKTFHSTTRYDWYLMQNTPNTNAHKTIVKFQDGVTQSIHTKGLAFIPSGEYRKIMGLIAKDDEECVNVIHDRSLYGTDKKHTSRTKTAVYTYPCVYTVNSKSELSYYYSNIQHGHFGIPKLIWSNGGIDSIGSYIDRQGDYGLTEFSYAIVDNTEVLDNIKKAFDTKDFRHLMKMCAVGQNNVNFKVIALLRKDFWKTFV